ncbi:hypothetical protein [Nocardia sp. NPDC052112]|uniref:aromatic-ring hydroxylase C-terminal domain-containing protein n=1 Tax=Nocardia sp. NPDC052112 TaxID=3155646 RepID=UPI003439224D
MSTTGRLTIAYPDSPLTSHAPQPDSSRVRSDAAGLDPMTGRRVRIFDLLRGPHWTLLTFDHGHPAPEITIDNPLADSPRRIRVTTDTTATGPDTIIDTDGSVHRNYEISESAAMLIRPDGYIAARTLIRL